MFELLLKHSNMNIKYYIKRFNLMDYIYYVYEDDYYGCDICDMCQHITTNYSSDEAFLYLLIKSHNYTMIDHFIEEISSMIDLDNIIHKMMTNKLNQFEYINNIDIIKKMTNYINIKRLYYH